MQRSEAYLCSVVTWGVLVLSSLLASAQEADSERQQHAWGRFEVGAWKRVRRFCETLDETGCVTGTSNTETTTTLVEVDERSYTLRIAVVVEVAGKRFIGQTQFKKQGFHGEIDGQSVSVTKLDAGEVVINRVKIASEMRQLVISGADTKQVSKIHYADTVYPFELKRDTTTTDSTGEAGRSSTSVEVFALDMPHKLLAEIKPVAHVKIIRRQPACQTITLEAHCVDVPGGVVAHTSKQLNSQGQVVARSTLELIDYGAVDSQVYTRPWWFRRFRRH